MMAVRCRLFAHKDHKPTNFLFITKHREQREMARQKKKKKKSTDRLASSLFIEHLGKLHRLFRKLRRTFLLTNHAAIEKSYWERSCYAAIFLHRKAFKPQCL